NTPADLTTDAHLVASGALASTGLPSGDQVDVPLLPLTFGGRRLGLRSDVPTPGEHNNRYRDGPADTSATDSDSGQTAKTDPFATDTDVEESKTQSQ
ncbi:MAG: CoA transferase, partial [Brevibacterium aurantiacum]